MAETITIRSATILDSRVVEVLGSTGRKAPREYTVHFDRHGNVKFGQWWVPDMGYLVPAEIPKSVTDAAIAAYQKGRT